MKTIISISTLALFAGAAMAEDINYNVTAETGETGSVYVGGTLLADESEAFGAVNIDISGGKISAAEGTYWKDGIFAGASEFGNENTSFSADRVVITMSGGDINNIVAGSFATEKGNTSIGSVDIAVSSGLVRNSVVGGSILTYYDVDGAKVGRAVSHVGSTNIIINGDAVIGENVSSAKDKSENNDIIFNSVYGGGYTVGNGTQSFDSTSVSIAGNAVVNGVVIGGSHAGPTGTAYVGDKNASDFSKIVSTVSISENAEIRGGYVFGGAYHSWGDGKKSSDIYGSTLVSVTGGKIFNSALNAGYVFGGGYSSDGGNAEQASISNVYGNTNVEISGGEVDNVFGGMYVNELCGYGSAKGEVMGDANIIVTGGKVANIYGGGMTERVTGKPSLSISTSVNGNANITVAGAEISGDIYGGGYGADSVVKGGATVTLNGAASVLGTVHGGGANGATVEGTKTLNIGSADSAFSGGALKVADFSHINVNNGSAKFTEYTQSSAGTLITIEQNGFLSVTLGADASQLSATTVSNGGRLEFKRGSLADGASAALARYSGAGAVRAFGGVFSDGVFTAGKSADISSGPVTVGTGDSDVSSVRFSAGGNKNLSLDFNIAGMGEREVVVNSISEVSDISGIDGEVKAAYSIDADYDGQLSVVFSAYIGEAEVANLLAWHREDGGQWELYDVEIEYKDGIASFIVDGFSSYAISQVPEPAAVAALFGAFALGIACCRAIAPRKR